MPGLVKAKSYLTGSSGENFLKALVISRAVLKSSCLRSVNLYDNEILCMCVSSGIISFDAEMPLHTPGSTSSFLIIHRRYKFILLYAHFPLGIGTRLL